VASACRAAYLPPGVERAAVRAARRIAADPALAALAGHCRRCLYADPGYPAERIRRWPALDPVLQADAGLFYLLVLLSAAPDLQTVYERRAIPEPVRRDTLYDIERRLVEYREQHGAWGLTARHLTWLRQHLRGDIFHLVRLQFAPGPFRAGVLVFRHHATGAVLALSEGGVRYRADGQPDGAGGVHDPQGGWEAHLSLRPGTVTGYPVLPVGRAVPQQVRLRRDEWRQVLAPGDPVLHVHIPAGSAMDFVRCGRSFAAALEFFPRHFPDRPFVGFACSSWLLDPRLQRLLPAASNIARLQREVYLLPGSSSGANTLVRVFGAVPEDLARAPRDTTLRRAILDHLQAGGHLSSGKCFLLREDLRWASQVYRRQAWPAEPPELARPCTAWDADERQRASATRRSGRERSIVRGESKEDVDA
jgi:hypothetical protein